MRYRVKKVVSNVRKHLDLNYWRTKNMVFLVYNASKVGSSTVLFSLKSKLWFSKILHIHFLTENKLKEFRKTGKWLLNIEKATKVNDILEKNKTKKLKIITLVREPISRDISGVFQSWEILFGVESIEDLQMNDILNHLNNSSFNHTEMWFENEFKKYTGLDILDIPFDKSKGYAIYRSSKFDVLCIRMESLNSSLEAAINDFVGVNGVEIQLTNVSEKKAGAHLYKELKSSYRLSKEKIDNVYSTRFMNHFYTQEELERFKAKWVAQEG